MHAYKSLAELQLAGGGRCLELRLLWCRNILKILSFKRMKILCIFSFFHLFCCISCFPATVLADLGI